MDSLFTILVIIALSALSNWVKRRMNPDSVEPDAPPRSPDQRPTPPGGSRPRPSTVDDWEKEVRKLFDMQEPERAEPPPAKPPVFVPPPLQRPLPARPPMRAERAPVIPRTSIDEEGERDPDEGPDRQLHQMAPPIQAPTKASHLIEETAARMQRVDELMKQHRVRTVELVGTKGAADSVQARQWLRDPASVRAVFVAGWILGPPKALESERG